MCEHGTTVTLSVPIPATDSHNGEFRWADKPVDSCIADLVAALNAGGVLTRSCCCGHGKHRPQIILHDGRSLVVGRTIAEAGLLAGPVRSVGVPMTERTTPELGSVWHEKFAVATRRDMDHSGRMYEVVAVANGYVTLDLPKVWKDRGLRLSGQRRTNMSVARLLRDFDCVRAVAGVAEDGSDA